MAARQRKGWDSLSTAYRDRLKRAGVTRRAYEAGADISKARGHERTSHFTITALTTRDQVWLEERSVSSSYRQSQWDSRTGRTDVKSRIGSHWNGVRSYILWGHTRVLDALRGYQFYGREVNLDTGQLGPRRSWSFMTDTIDIYNWWYGPDASPSFEDIYEQVSAA